MRKIALAGKQPAGAFFIARKKGGTMEKRETNIGQPKPSGMPLSKAIEILEDLLKTSARDKSSDSWDALKLGKEAMKAWKEERKGLEPGEYKLLPGETND